MTTHDESNDRQLGAEANGSRGRLFVLIGLLALALFALWYDYKVARPAVEQAYERIAAKNADMNAAAEHRMMTSVEVQEAIGRVPNDTFLLGRYTVEAYRWSAGMPIELRGLSGDESPGIGRKTHDYFAVYRKDGPVLAFATHFKFDLDEDYFVETPIVASGDAAPDAAETMPGMEANGGGPGGGGRGSFDPEAMFAERDADGDGKLTGDELSDRMRENLEEIDTDSDGSVSKEELVARMSQRGGRGGQGGPRGEGEGRRQRPPLESADETPDSAPASSDASTAAEPKEPTSTSENASTEGTPQADGDVPKE